VEKRRDCTHLIGVKVMPNSNGRACVITDVVPSSRTGLGYVLTMKMYCADGHVVQTRMEYTELYLHDSHYRAYDIYNASMSPGPRLRHAMVGDLIITRYDVLVHLKFNDRKEFTYWSTTYGKLITVGWMGAYVGEMPSEDA
jgi:hypothetical protein